MQYSTLTMSNSLSFSSYSTFSSSSLKSGANALQFSCVKIQRSPVVWKLFFSHFTASFNNKWNLNQPKLKLLLTQLSITITTKTNPPPPPHKKPKWIKITQNPRATVEAAFIFHFLRCPLKYLTTMLNTTASWVLNFTVHMILEGAVIFPHREIFRKVSEIVAWARFHISSLLFTLSSLCWKGFIWFAGFFLLPKFIYYYIYALETSLPHDFGPKSRLLHLKSRL